MSPSPYSVIYQCCRSWPLSRYRPILPASATRPCYGRTPTIPQLMMPTYSSKAGSSLSSDESKGSSRNSRRLGKGNLLTRLYGQTARQQSHPGASKHQESPAEEAPQLQNYYEGQPCAWQITETVDDFLLRLPPATTDQTRTCPWIYISNLYVRRGRQEKSEETFSDFNEYKTPDEDQPKSLICYLEGKERLRLLTTLIVETAMPERPKDSKQFELKIRGTIDQTRDDILRLAQVNQYTAGKWMLFCPDTTVNETWELVAKATANNELGIAAKVAPRPQVPRESRLICVYTKDFADRADVKRVLDKLRDLKLVKSGARPIYYKPDVFTIIGINSGNFWDMKASLYSSADPFLASST